MDANGISVEVFLCLKITMRGRNVTMEIVEEFKKYIMEGGKSINTIQSYVGEVTAFKNTLEQ